MGGQGATSLKSTEFTVMFNELLLDDNNLGIYSPVSNLPFLALVSVKLAVKSSDFLDPIQSGFQPVYGMETALVPLADIILLAMHKRFSLMIAFRSISRL